MRWCSWLSMIICSSQSLEMLHPLRNAFKGHVSFLIRKLTKPLQVDSRLSLAQFLCFRLGVFVVVSIVGCDRDVFVAIELVVTIEIGTGIVIHVVHNLSVRGLVLISSLNSTSPPLSMYHQLAVKLEKKRG